MPVQGHVQCLPNGDGHVADIDELAVFPGRRPFRVWVTLPSRLDPLVHARVPDPGRAQRHGGDGGPGGEARAQILGQALGQPIGTHGAARVGVTDREVIGKPLALGDPEHLAAGEVHHPGHAGGPGGQQHVPGPEDVDGHDVLGAARRVVGERPGVHDGGAAVRRGPDRGGIQEIIAVGAVVADNVMAQVLQVSRDRAAHVTAMPRNQNAQMAKVLVEWDFSVQA